jgi:hypothetical protein
LQDHRWSEPLFYKITGSGQNGHLVYPVCRMRVIIAATFLNALAGPMTGYPDCNHSGLPTKLTSGRG